jgi:hypothetical protein
LASSILSDGDVYRIQVLDLVEAHDWPSSGTITNTEDNKVATFSFDFPLHRKVSWEQPNDLMAASTYPILPSSISVTGYGCRATNRFSCSATTQVRYELQAFAFENDECVDQLISSITLFDTALPSPPPIYQGHFQGEYACSKQKYLTKLAMRGSKLTIKVSEPAPLEIKPRPEGGVIMAAVPIRLCLQSESKRAKKEPPQLSLAVTSVLKTSTYLSVCKLHAHPTIAASQDSPYLAALTKHSTKRVRNLTVDGWQREESNDTVTWVRDMTVLLPVVENTFPAPSFFTPFIARRYSLGLRLDVKSAWGDAAYRLTVPLQIVYPECPINYEHIYNPHLVDEHTSSSDSLPIYIR